MWRGCFFSTEFPHTFFSLKPTSPDHIYAGPTIPLCSEDSAPPFRTADDLIEWFLKSGPKKFPKVRPIQQLKKEEDGGFVLVDIHASPDAFAESFCNHISKSRTKQRNLLIKKCTMVIEEVCSEWNKKPRAPLISFDNTIYFRHAVAENIFTAAKTLYNTVSMYDD